MRMEGRVGRPLKFPARLSAAYTQLSLQTVHTAQTAQPDSSACRRTAWLSPVLLIFTVTAVSGSTSRRRTSRTHGRPPPVSIRGGTTTLLASLVTADRTALLAGTERLAGLAESGDIACIHLEGPFLSQARCGAQNPDWLIDPNMSLTRELVRTARGALRTMTFAPELPSTNELVDVLASLGVVPSVGHTASSPEVAGQALARAHHELSRHHHTAGRVPTVTHLFNGMEPMHHRSPGAVSARGTCRQGNRGAHRR